MITILAIISIEQVLQLGLGGLAIITLAKIIKDEREDNRTLNDKLIDEINKRDERFNKLQEDTLTALDAIGTTLTEVVKAHEKKKSEK